MRDTHDTRDLRMIPLIYAWYLVQCVIRMIPGAMRDTHDTSDLRMKPRAASNTHDTRDLRMKLVI
jgi:hypothetical protein